MWVTVLVSFCLITDLLAEQCQFRVFESITVAFEGDDFGVVNDRVDHRWRDGVVVERISPNGRTIGLRSG